MSKILDLETTRTLANEAVAERGPKFQYCTPEESGMGAACAYVPTTDPRCPIVGRSVVSAGAKLSGCLVGEIYKRAGLLTDTLASATSSIGGLISNGVVRVADDNTRMYLHSLQMSQDSGSQWGQCIANAESMLKNARMIEREKSIKEREKSI